MNSDTLLLRQIHPSFVQNGRVTSQAFRPTPKDENKLSVYDGDKITVADSIKHFTSNPLCRSVDVMIVSHGECTEQNIAVVPDGVPFPEHAYLDFSNMSKGDVERKAKALTAKAQARQKQITGMFHNFDLQALEQESQLTLQEAQTIVQEAQEFALQVFRQQKTHE